MELPAREALAMTMVLHELCTNALKYGALSQTSGRVAVTWAEADSASGKSLAVIWQERDGPAVAPPPEKRGFGTRLMARAFGEAGSANVAFDASGVSCRITLRLEPEEVAACPSRVRAG
jgi:two-component sensor histidine kinase